MHKYEFQHFCLLDKPLPLNDGQSIIFLNAKGVAKDISSGLENFLNFVDNKDVEDEFVNEIKGYIEEKMDDAVWRWNYMDNDTHMYFREIEIEERTGNRYLAVIKEIFKCQKEGMDQEKIIARLKNKFSFTDNEIEKIFS